MRDIVGQLKVDGRSVVAISHHVDFCAQNFARIIVMAQGRILSDGPPEELFQQDEILAEAHVEPPQISRLATELRMPGGVIDNEAFLSAL